MTTASLALALDGDPGTAQPVHATNSPAWKPLRPGDRLADRYRIERVIGQGAMGVVVSAIHEQLEDRVAIKMLLPDVLGDAEAVQRFRREARVMRSLRSEHVVRVLDFAEVEGQAPFLVLEHLEGQDLGQRLEGGPLPVVEAVDHALQAMVALAEAHARGLVHRDIKPANLFLTRRADGTPLIKVLDFGISKRPEVDQDLTRNSGMMGSPLYVSPEQMRSARLVDARSDVWSLGVTLFELMTGRCPFEGASLTTVLLAIATEPPPAFASLGVDVAPGLEAVITRCLEKRPADRFASVQELAEALAPFASPAGARSVESIAGVARQPARASVPSVRPTPAARSAAPESPLPAPPAPPAPETATPQTATPQTATPQTATPQTVTPQTVTPQTVTSQTVTSQTVILETATRETATRETAKYTATTRPSTTRGAPGAGWPLALAAVVMLVTSFAVGARWLGGPAVGSGAGAALVAVPSGPGASAAAPRARLASLPALSRAGHHVDLTDRTGGHR